MKLWLIEQNTNNERYDVFDSAVVAAETEDEARRTHPNNSAWPWHEWDKMSWVDDPASVVVFPLGEAIVGRVAGVICASFNAG